MPDTLTVADVQAKLNAVRKKIDRILEDELLQTNTDPNRMVVYENTATTLPALRDYEKQLVVQIKRMENGGIIIATGVPRF